MTRGDFLGFGLLGTIMGAVLTIPPVAFVLDPIIRTDVLGQTDVYTGWEKVGPVSGVEEEDGVPSAYEVEFPIQQTYSNESAQQKFPNSQKSDAEFTIKNAVWISWKREVVGQGEQGSVGDELGERLRPSFLNDKSEGFTEQERQEIADSLNVLSNSCAHLGCPVRWLVNADGQGEFLCPCHGGIYDINGGWVGGPPPRGMYRYTQVKVDEDGMISVKHEYDIQDRLDAQQPYVV